MTDAATDPGAALLPRVAAVMQHVLGVELAEVTPAALLTDDLNLDALDVIDVGMKLEAAFGIEITDDDLADMTCTPMTVAQLLAMLHAKGARA